MVHGDRDASREFVVLHRPLARQMSKWVKVAFGLTADDAEQIGAVGLIEAARRFDPARGIRFSPYAKFWIYKECQTLDPNSPFSSGFRIWFARPSSRSATSTGNSGPRIRALVVPTTSWHVGKKREGLSVLPAMGGRGPRATSVRSLQSPAWRVDEPLRGARGSGEPPVRDEPLLPCSRRNGTACFAPQWPI